MINKPIRGFSILAASVLLQLYLADKRPRTMSAGQLPLTNPQGTLGT